MVGLYAAIFYLAELVLSPIFGILSDRIGHHRVMLYGPVFGGDRGRPDRADDEPARSSAATRLLEGASTAASVPSILGFIALATAGNELLRGKAAARFEGATLAGLGFGFIVAPKLFEAIGPTAFFLNAVVYGVSFLIYWRGVKDPAGEARRSPSPHVGFAGYLDAHPVARTSWFLAPTWIARQRQHRPVVQPVAVPVLEGQPGVPRPVADGGLRRQPDHGRARSPSPSSSGPACIYWGNRFKSMRRTTIIGYGLVGGAALVGAGLVVNHSVGLAGRDHAGSRRRRRGRAVRAGRGDARGPRVCWPTSPSASPPTAARSWVSTPSSWLSGRSSAA